MLHYQPLIQVKAGDAVIMECMSTSGMLRIVGEQKKQGWLHLCIAQGHMHTTYNILLSWVNIYFQ